MDKIITGFGVLLFTVGLVVGYASGIGLEHNVSIGFAQNWLIEAVAAFAFMVISGLMVFFGIRKF